MTSDVVLKSSLVENAKRAMMSEQEQRNEARLKLVESLQSVDVALSSSV